MFDWITPQLIAIGLGIVKAVVILIGLVLSAAYMIWLERRLLGLWQDRYGPNRIGPLGLGQVIADMLKIFFKEDWTPPFAEKFSFWLAPLISMSLMLMPFCLVPITPTWGVASAPLGMLFFFAAAGLAVYAVMLAGWSSNSKYSLLGGLRSSAQMISYEVFMGLSLMGVVMQAGSFDLREIVIAQQQQGWFVFPQILAFIPWSLAAIAVTHRTPFDLPEAESELAAGYHTEYAGMKFGMFFVGEYVGVVLVSSLTTALFFGGWDAPLNILQGLPFLWFAIKTFIFMSGFILIRAALPRPRYDQMMGLAWKVCLPMTLINLLLTGAWIVWRSQGAA